MQKRKNRWRAGTPHSRVCQWLKRWLWLSYSQYTTLAPGARQRIFLIRQSAAHLTWAMDNFKSLSDKMQAWTLKVDKNLLSMKKSVLTQYLVWWLRAVADQRWTLLIYCFRLHWYGQHLKTNCSGTNTDHLPGKSTTVCQVVQLPKH